MHLFINRLGRTGMRTRFCTRRMWHFTRLHTWRCVTRLLKLCSIRVAMMYRDIYGRRNKIVFVMWQILNSSSCPIDIVPSMWINNGASDAGTQLCYLYAQRKNFAHGKKICNFNFEVFMKLMSIKCAFGIIRACAF